MKTSSVPVYEFAGFRLDAAKRLLRRSDGTPLPLTPRVFETLLYLVEHGGQVLERDRVMEAVWPDAVVEENNLTQNISILRRVLGQERGSNEFIVTVPGRGYRFVPDVKTADHIETTAMEPARPRAEVSTNAHPLPIERPSARGRAGSIALAGAVVLLGIVASVWWSKSADRKVTPLASEKSIAVLPFANLSGDPENAYFADGVKDEILTRLSKVADLKVISNTSTQKFKSKPDNIREIAGQLGVAHILEGSVQRSGDTVRVTVQLIHATSDTHVWAETYDRKIADMFQMETEVAERIATALAATLTGTEKAALQEKPTANVAAYHSYLRGRYFWNKRTVEGYRLALVHFNRALDEDPAYAQAYAGLADACLFLSGDDAAGQREALTRGRAALRKALELDDTLAEAHASLGLLELNFDWNWAKAEEEFKRSLALNPNYATAHQWYGEFLVSMGRSDEGIAEIKKAAALDPLSVVISTDVGKVYLLARRYDEAVAQFHRALEMDPQFAVAHGLLALTLSFQGKHEEAIAQIQQIGNIDSNPMHLGWQGYVCGRAGRKTEAENALKQLDLLARRIEVSPHWPTLVYLGLEQKDAAFAELEKAFQEKAVAGAIPLKANPIFDPLRSDPRYADLLRRAHFAP